MKEMEKSFTPEERKKLEFLEKGKLQ